MSGKFTGLYNVSCQGDEKSIKDCATGAWSSSTMCPSNNTITLNCSGERENVTFSWFIDQKFPPLYAGVGEEDFHQIREIKDYFVCYWTLLFWRPSSIEHTVIWCVIWNRVMFRILGLSRQG